MIRRAPDSSGKKPRRSRGEIDALLLDLLAKSNRPPSAYDLAASASSKGISIVPNQVYRTLTRLIDEGRVMRIETLNAYALCQSYESTACLVCFECQCVIMIAADPAEERLKNTAASAGFKLRPGTLEARGLCSDCGLS